MVRKSTNRFAMLVATLLVGELLPAAHAGFQASPPSGNRLDTSSLSFGRTRDTPKSFGSGRRTASVATFASNDEWSLFHFNDEPPSEKDKNKNIKPEMLADQTKNTQKQDGSSPFSTGADLKQLRIDLESYRENLKWAKVVNDRARIKSLRKEIEEKEKKDPEIVYNMARFLIAEAKAASNRDMTPDVKEKVIKHWSEQAKLARACLPRFQMEGLWVGNYGGGPQLVNITYCGDTLVATKVTNDATVPRGEVSFTANLSPPPLNNSDIDDEPASSKYSSPPSPSTEEHTVLQSKYGESIFPGQGQLAKKNFKDRKFISGVFIVYDAWRFSFSWVPTKHHVFFVRPSPQETIRLLRDVISKEDEIDNMREYLDRCYETDMTTSIARQQQRNSVGEAFETEDPFRRIKRQSDLDLLKNAMESSEANRRGGSIFTFWRANKWKKYIDRVLGNDVDDLGTLQ